MMIQSCFKGGNGNVQRQKLEVSGSVGVCDSDVTSKRKVCGLCLQQQKMRLVSQNKIASKNSPIFCVPKQNWKKNKPLTPSWPVFSNISYLFYEPIKIHRDTPTAWELTTFQFMGERMPVGLRWYYRCNSSVNVHRVDKLALNWGQRTFRHY